MDSREPNNDFVKELRNHLDLEAEENLAEGISAREAQDRARRAFGNTTIVSEDVRAVWHLQWLENLWQDARYGVRQLSKNPTFTLVAIITLALGIGANTAMFSIADAVLWRSMPYPHPEQLVVASEVPRSAPDSFLGTTYLTFRDWQSRSTVFQNLAATMPDQRILREGSDPVRVNGVAVTHDFFDVMGVSPILGRVISKSDDVTGAPPVVVLSHRMWTERFGGDPNIVGRTIHIGRTLTFSAIGVMPAGFDDDSVDYWVPMMLIIPPNFATRHVWIFHTVGRLRPGCTAAQAQAELDSMLQQIEHDFPEANRGYDVRVNSLRTQTSTDLRPALLVLLGAVGLVLLIACANLAALISVRAAGRSRELAVRAALGASRARLIAQLLTESALLSLAGGITGVALAYWATRSLALLSKDPRLLHAAINLPVLLFAFAAVAITSVLAGIAPAMQHSRDTLNSRNSGHRRRARLQQSLVVSEIALCLVLLVGAGLLFKTLRNILDVDAGFRTDHLVTMSVTLPPTYTDQPQMFRFYRDAAERLQSLPGISGASVVNALPVAPGEANGDITLEGRPAAPGANGAAGFRRSLPNYFQMMGIPLLRGRDFDERDDGVNKDRVVIINDRFARKFWPGDDPIGKRIKIGPPDNNPWLTIVGVVQDIHQTGLEYPIGFTVYEPLAQSVGNDESVAIRTQGDPAAIISEVRSELHRMEPTLLVDKIETMDQRIEDSVSPRKLNLFLFGLFSALALVLASIGLYGVVAYSVGQRTQEFGIRMALGAQPRDVLRLVLTQGLKLALAGTVIGITVALALSSVVRQLLFGVRPADPFTIACVALILTIVALVACWLPAFRASRIEPTQALRIE
jgi:putative ABC transport system permease protein